MREKGQGADTVSDLQLIANGRIGRWLKTCLFARLRVAIKKLFKKNKVCSGDTKCAAHSTGTDKGHIDAFLSYTLYEIDKRSIGG